MSPAGGEGLPLRARGRLRTRMILSFSVLVALAVTLTSWVALTRVERASSRGFERRVDTLLKGVHRRLSTLGRETSARLESLVSAALDQPFVGPLLVRPDPGNSHVIEAASRMRSQSGLDLLQILDDKGVILSSAQWPERVGFESRELLALDEGEPEFRYERTPQEEILAQVVHRTAELGDRRVHLVGGKILNDAFLRQVSPAQGEMVLLLDVQLQPRAAVGGVTLAEVTSARFEQGLRDAMATGQEAGGGLRLEDGSLWTAGTSPVRSAGGELLGTLVVAADREELDQLMARLRNRFLVIGMVGVLLAAGAGLWVAHRITQPLEELVRAVDDLSAGREHEPLRTADDGEIGRLVTAFSRMDRSLREQQKRLLASERVAAWKEVAQRVAHEVKNPLSPIRLTVENLIKARRQAPELFDELFEDGTRAILEEVTQLGNIVTEFTQFARLPAPRPEWMDLEAVVDSVVALYSKHEGLTVKRVRAQALDELFLDRELMSRAVKNLVKNAVEAMAPQGGGELRVTTGMDGEDAYIEVCDTGPGFPEDTQGAVFKPYFTTKEKGTGLGMAIALRIISEHNGSLSADNRPEGGARVRVTLPPVGALGYEPAQEIDHRDRERESPEGQSS